MTPRSSLRARFSRDARGEVLPVAILFVMVMFTILMGVHVVVVAMARTAVQSAADAAVAAAQAAGDTPANAREEEGRIAAQLALIAARSSVIETRDPALLVEPERGQVTAVVFGGAISPLLGGVEVTGRACGPLDDVPASALAGTGAWQC